MFHRWLHINQDSYEKVPFIVSVKKLSPLMKILQLSEKLLDELCETRQRMRIF